MRWAITFAFALRRSTSGGFVCRCDMNSNSIFHARYQSQSKRDKNEKKELWTLCAWRASFSALKTAKGQPFLLSIFFFIFISCLFVVDVVDVVDVRVFGILFTCWIAVAIRYGALCEWQVYTQTDLSLYLNRLFRYKMNKIVRLFNGLSS